MDNLSKYRKKLLLLEDEKTIFKQISFGLSTYDLVHAESIKSASIALRNYDFDLILVDLNLDINKPNEFQGLPYIKKLRDKYPTLPIIVMSRNGGVEQVKTAIQYGADDFFYKPDRLYEVWRKRIEALTNEKKARGKNYPFVGISEHFQKIEATLRKKGNSKDHILLQGDIGIGKSSAARFYHVVSKRAFQKFYPIDISYYSEEKDVETIFNVQKRGIVFIKAIDTLSPRAQAFLHRIIVDQKLGEVDMDIQFIATTTREIETLVHEHQFRSDLFFSFTVIKILPLKERKADIEFLLDFYLKREANLGINQLVDKDAKRILLNYEYPHNISELIQVSKHIMNEKGLQGKAKVDKDCLPNQILVPGKGSIEFELSELHKARANTDLEYVESALKATYGQKGKAAKLMGLKPDDMRYMVHKHFGAYPELFSNFPKIRNAYKLPSS